MPPRPPLTTLMIHTWKEHGKPRPFSDDEFSEQITRRAISTSISHESHLSAILHPDPTLVTRPLSRPAILRSISVEEGLLRDKVNKKINDLLSSATSEDDEEDEFEKLCVKTREVGEGRENLRIIGNSPRLVIELLPPRPAQMQRAKETKRKNYQSPSEKKRVSVKYKRSRSIRQTRVGS